MLELYTKKIYDAVQDVFDEVDNLQVDNLDYCETMEEFSTEYDDLEICLNGVISEAKLALKIVKEAQKLV